MANSTATAQFSLRPTCASIHSDGNPSVSLGPTPRSKERATWTEENREAGPNLASLPFFVIDFSMTLAKLPVFNSF
jgi:hypothetical protein